MSPSLLHTGFVESCEAMPERPALDVERSTYTYRELLSEALTLAATLQSHDSVEGPLMTGVFADRSAAGFAGILAALLAGGAYLPLNPHYPALRTRWMIEHARCGALIVDDTALPQLDKVLAGARSPVLVILPDGAHGSDYARRWPQHHIVGAHDRTPASLWSEPDVSPDDLAYLLFTSGSSGEPKGVPVTHANATHFVNAMVERYAVEPADRFSQMFDTTFDLSVFDLFVAWRAGACVCCPSRQTLLNPSRFIRDNALTVWFSVPTVGLLMHRFGGLRADTFPSLRWSLFCGEPLPTRLATEWADAARNSQIENLYGPTELTVACTTYRWNADRSPAESVGGIAPIGYPLPGMQARVVNEKLEDVEPGEVGELLMAGPQRTCGYWEDEEATARAHVRLPRSDDVFYRTGDRVRRPKGDLPLTYVGRVDHQIKVFGHRIDLGEVESALRQEPGVLAAVAVGWPLSTTGASGIAAFVTGTGINTAAIESNLRSKLETHAVPQTIRVLPELPQNANGKIDREALLRLLPA